LNRCIFRSPRRTGRCEFSAADTIWHLDEMVVFINGRKYWLWRAVDSEGEVLAE